MLLWHAVRVGIHLFRAIGCGEGRDDMVGGLGNAGESRGGNSDTERQLLNFSNSPGL